MTEDDGAIDANAKKHSGKYGNMSGAAEEPAAALAGRASAGSIADGQCDNFRNGEAKTREGAVADGGLGFKERCSDKSAEGNPSHVHHPDNLLRNKRVSARRAQLSVAASADRSHVHSSHPRVERGVIFGKNLNFDDASFRPRVIPAPVRVPVPWVKTGKPSDNALGTLRANENAMEVLNAIIEPLR